MTKTFQKKKGDQYLLERKDIAKYLIDLEMGWPQARTIWTLYAHSFLHRRRLISLNNSSLLWKENFPKKEISTASRALKPAVTVSISIWVDLAPQRVGPYTPIPS